jgi:hypothetical protein
MHNTHTHTSLWSIIPPASVEILTRLNLQANSHPVCIFHHLESYRWMMQVHSKPWLPLAICNRWSASQSVDETAHGAYETKKKPPPLLSRSTNITILSQMITQIHFPSYCVHRVCNSFGTLHTDFLFTPSYSLHHYLIIFQIQIFRRQQGITVNMPHHLSDTFVL